jgi:hypothetical protein
MFLGWYYLVLNLFKINLIKIIFYRNLFHNVIGFGTKDFIPHTSWSLLSKLLFKHFINRLNLKDALRVLLNEESNLGTHTDIFVYYARFNAHPWSLIRYTWAQSFSRPFTLNKPLQCPGCGRMPGSIIYTCRKSADRSAVAVLFKCGAETCDWQQEKFAPKTIIDMKDHHSIVDKVGKPWAANNGQWCFEEMKPITSF